MVLIERVDVKHYKFTSQIPREESLIKDGLKIWIEGAQFSDKFKKGFWDGYFRLYNNKNQFELGLLDEVCYNLQDKNVKFEIEEFEFREKTITDYILDTRLHPHQKEGVQAFFSSNYGLMVIPTRGGKTFVSGEIIKHVTNELSNSTVLFYVDTTDLFDQTVEEIAKYLNLAESEIGKINSFGVDLKQITVAMIQTVTSIFNRKKPEAKDLERFFRRLTFLVVDEVQEYLGDNRMRLIKKCKNVDFLLGLSATPFKHQGDMTSNLKMKGFFGGIVYDVSKVRLQEEGHLALDKAILITHEHDLEKVKCFGKLSGTEKYQAYQTKLIHENKDRNKILLDVIGMCEKNKWKTLILFNSKKHGYLVSEYSGKTFLSGDDDTKKRNEEKERFLRGRGKILLASNIFKKGITLPEVEVIVIADGGLEGSNIIQKMGRVLGAVEGKEKAVVMDVMDIEPEYFSNHSSKRLEVYSENIGDDRIECYGEDDMSEIEDSIKSWFDEK